MHVCLQQIMLTGLQEALNRQQRDMTELRERLERAPRAPIRNNAGDRLMISDIDSVMLTGNINDVRNNPLQLNNLLRARIQEYVRSPYAPRYLNLKHSTIEAKILDVSLNGFDRFNNV
jgi:hypothetical protein